MQGFRIRLTIVEFFDSTQISSHIGVESGSQLVYDARLFNAVLLTK